MGKNNISDGALAEFLAECDEITQRVATHLTTLEKNDPNDEANKKIIDALYRDVHTLKGSSQLFGYQLIGNLAHAMETSIDPVRRHGLAIPERLVDAQLMALDVIEKLIGQLRDGQDDSHFKEEVENKLPHLVDAATSMFDGDYELLKDDEGVDEQLELTPSKENSENISHPSKLQSAEKKAVDSQTREKSSSSNLQSSSSEGVNEPASASESTSTNAPVTSKIDTTIRVQVGLLDKLMNLVGELVLTRNQLLQYARKTESQEFSDLSQKLDVITSDLQGEVMKTRMQPIGNVLSKFQRIVRDVASDLGKKINLILEGTETELDKTLLEAIKDPLTHIIRNSCDHGIEKPEDRLNAGKKEEGTISIRSFHEGGQVIIQISDDGQGLNKEKILNKAIERNVITSQDKDNLTDKQIHLLIFQPGFSTAEKVSNVSGRGVGMDVVKTNIEKIGGTVDLHSEFGKGSEIKLKIPLTLAIVPAMLARCGEDIFAIPQVKLVELVRTENDSEINEEGDQVSNGSSAVEFLQGEPVYRLRGDLLPLVNFEDVLIPKTNSQDREESRKKLAQEANIVVLNNDGTIFGLVVDEILDRADIVVKPLPKFLKELKIFSGATIMGDGTVALILDIGGISDIARARKQMIEQKTDEVFDGDLSVNQSDESLEIQDYLLFKTALPGKFAIPLCLVHRLEEFSKEQVQFSGEQAVVQYRDSILPIISLSRFLDQKSQTRDAFRSIEKFSVIVAQKQGRDFGILVEEILDAVQIEMNLNDTIADREGILGNLIHREEVITVIDVLEVLDKEIARMDYRNQEGQSLQTEMKQKMNETPHLTILLAEDTVFFRRQLIRVLESHGHQVDAFEDGEKAFQAFEKNPNQYQMVISDIEMPKLNGFELAKAIRASKENASIPLIAVTTRFRDRDIEEGKAAGFNLYLEKLNPEELIRGVNELYQRVSADKASQGSTKRPKDAIQ
ncbi:MAG: histidine kinase [Phyllobacteriaceae bacterium]|nr:histidine kinase [Phyllobacteriaceae bacterium]